MDPQKDNQDPGLRVTAFGSLVNLFLLAVKFVVGALTGSVALIADGVHSTSDLATDLVVFGGIRLGGRKADASHPYGHGRYETMAGGIVAAILIGVGLFIVWEAGTAFYAHAHHFPGPAVLVVAAVSILAKEGVYRRTIAVARKVNSTALHANAWHHRSDALSSVAVLLGGAGGLLGWGHADQVAGIVVGLMVSASGGSTLYEVMKELTEGTPCAEDLEAIKQAVRRVPRVEQFHQLRTRRVGREVFVDLHVLVEPALSLLEGHRISMQVEEAVRNACRQPVNVMVHVEPDLPELQDHHEENV
jgi:cation diffusion facilitator family transporter